MVGMWRRIRLVSLKMMRMFRLGRGEGVGGCGFVVVVVRNERNEMT